MPYKNRYFLHKKPLCGFAVSGMQFQSLSSILLRPFQAKPTRLIKYTMSAIPDSSKAELKLVNGLITTLRVRAELGRHKVKGLNSSLSIPA